MTKKGCRDSKPSAEKEVGWQDPLALRAFRAVLKPRHRSDRSAALAMWQRIAEIDLATEQLGASELQFIQTVAVEMIGADDRESKERPDAVLVASGLYGKRREEVDTRIEELMDTLDAFEHVSMIQGTVPPAPTAVQKKYSKRNQSIAHFAEDNDLMRKVPDVQALRKRIEKVKDSKRKK